MKQAAQMVIQMKFAPCSMSGGNTKNLSLTPPVGRLMLLTCAMLWGGSYPTAKVAMSAISVQWLMACRELAAALVMLLLFRKHIIPYLNRKIVVPTLAVGATYYFTMFFQMKGLTTIEPGRSSFLTASYCVIIPFTSWLLLHQKPTQRNIIAALICILGVGFISMNSGLGGLSLSFGDMLTLACAVIFSFNLVFLGKWAKAFDPIALTFVMFAFSGAAFLIGALFTEPSPTAAWLQPDILFCLIYLFFLATMLAQVMQNVGLKVVRPAQASIIMCTEGAFAVLFSVLFYGEKLTVTTVIGFILVFIAMVYSQLRLKHNVTVTPSGSNTPGSIAQ